MPTSLQSPVAAVLELLLKQPFPDRTQVGLRKDQEPASDKEFLLLSYRSDFGALWDVSERFLAWLTDGTRTIVLVWEETPADGGVELIRLSEYVTAFDWAVALCLLADFYAREHKRNPSWRLVIADLASRMHSSADGVRLFAALQRRDAPFLPWVQGFRPEELFDGLIDFLKISPREHKNTADLDVFRKTWAAMLVNPGRANDRHAIINLIAPQLLLAGMRRVPPKKEYTPPPRISGHEKLSNPVLDAQEAKNIIKNENSSLLIGALETLMRAVGLTPDTAGKQLGPWVPPRKWQNVVQKFILIDDMADIGWKDFLCSALAAEEDQIEAHIDPRCWTSVGEQNKIVLFLDLRLFARNPGSEIQFFAELAEAASDFRIEEDEPADSGFYDAELEAIQRVIKSGAVSGPDYYTALTFLPRLISLHDPTLPIVIFSSTGRKEIAEALRPYGNVVLGFDKPRFFGEASSAVLSETRQKFEMAMDRALVLAEGRGLCRSFRKDTSSAGGGRIVEIFLDESRSEDFRRFAIGGFVLVHPSESHPDQLDADLRSAGLVWTKSAAHPSGAPTLPKDPANYNRHLALLQNFFEERGFEVFALGLVRSRWPVGSQPRSLLLREGSLDLRNLDMVTDVVEAGLFDIVEHVAPQPSSICVHLATRVYPIDKDLLQDNRAIENWGLSLPTWSNKMNYTVSPQDGHRITRIALRRRISHAFGLPIDRARAVSLDNPRVPPQAREIHHLADWIARFARMEYQDVPDIAKTWFAKGFLVEGDEAFSCWLEAARAGDEGCWIQALHCAYQARAIEKRRHEHGMHLSYSKFVDRKAADWPSNLSPGEFGQLCGRLIAEPGYKLLRVDGVNGIEEGLAMGLLTEVFQQFGEVAKVQIKFSYALVSMGDEISAGRAVRAGNTRGLFVKNRKLRISPAWR